MTHTISFHECEHNGDMQNYINDLIEAGAQIENSKINLDAEVCYITVLIDDLIIFLAKSKETDAYEFSSLQY